MSELQSVNGGGNGEEMVQTPNLRGPDGVTVDITSTTSELHMEKSHGEGSGDTVSENKMIDNDTEISNKGSDPVAVVAPALRVEELKEDYHSSTYGSDEEGVLSHGDASDLDISVNSQGEEQTSPNDKLMKEFVPPTEELRDKIIKQVEFYFSDANILKDAFLLKHVRRNKQGFVSLKLITSFRKVKSLTKDYRVVAFSLRLSEHLEVNEEGTKVKRTTPLPDYDETTPSRSIVAVNLPSQNLTIESVAELFSKCGDIALVRILKPGKSIPQDVKKHIIKHPEIGNSVCAVVEFENHESAAMACQNMTDTDDWRKGLRVVLLAASKKDKTNKEQSTPLSSHPCEDSEASPDKDDKKSQRHRAKKKKVPTATLR